MMENYGQNKQIFVVLFSEFFFNNFLFLYRTFSFVKVLQTLITTKNSQKIFYKKNLKI